MKKNSLLILSLLFNISTYFLNGQIYQIVPKQNLTQFEDNILTVSRVEDYSNIELKSINGQIIKKTNYFIYRTKNIGLETFTLFKNQIPIDTFCFYVNPKSSPKIAFKRRNNIGTEFYIDSIIINDENSLYEIKQYNIFIVDYTTNKLLFSNKESSNVLSNEAIKYLCDLKESKVNKKLKLYLTDFVLNYNGFEVNSQNLNISYTITSSNEIVVPPPPDKRRD